MASQIFNVWLKGKVIDVITYNATPRVDTKEVKQSLINHDGYNPNIKVTRARK